MTFVLQEGHYILETSDDDHDHEYSKKLYTGLGKTFCGSAMHCSLVNQVPLLPDMVDEAKETYVKNPLDLDSPTEKHRESPELCPSAPQDALDSPDRASHDHDRTEDDDDDEDRLPPV
jgi:hypothetical protein